MIDLTMDQWRELAEIVIDDSAGPVDNDWDWCWDQNTDTVKLVFDQPSGETMFRLRYSEYINV
jgi:hypothetical protein